MYTPRQSLTRGLLCSGTILIIGGIFSGLLTITFYGILFFIPGLILFILKRMYIKGKFTRAPRAEARSETDVKPYKNQTKNVVAQKKSWEQTTRQKPLSGDSFDEFFAEEKKKNQSYKSS